MTIIEKWKQHVVNGGATGALITNLSKDSDCFSNELLDSPLTSRLHVTNFGSTIQSCEGRAAKLVTGLENFGENIPTFTERTTTLQ